MNKPDWNKVYKQESPKLLGVCKRYISDISLCQDLLHDAFITAISKYATFKNEGAFEGWLRRIVVNTVLQHLRAQKQMQVETDVVEEIAEEAFVEVVKDQEFTKKQLLEAIAQLPEHHRTVFNLYVFEGYKHQQISDVLGISVGTSKSHLSRARAKLMKILEEMTQKNKKKRALLWLFPSGGTAVDQIFRTELDDLEISPNTIDFDYNSVTDASPSFSFSKLIVPSVFVLGGILGSVITSVSIESEIPEPIIQMNKVVVHDTVFVDRPIYIEKKMVESMEDTVKVVVRKPLVVKKPVRVIKKVKVKKK